MEGGWVNKKAQDLKLGIENASQRQIYDEQSIQMQSAFSHGRNGHRSLIWEKINATIFKPDWPNFSWIRFSNARDLSCYETQYIFLFIVFFMTSGNNGQNGVENTTPSCKEFINKDIFTLKKVPCWVSDHMGCCGVKFWWASLWSSRSTKRLEELNSLNSTAVGSRGLKKTD